MESYKGIGPGKPGIEGVPPEITLYSQLQP